MTETMSSVACAGPVMVEGGSFMIEAAAMEEEEEMAEAAADEEEGAEMAEAAEAEEEGCAFAVSGTASHRYRAWHSWDIAGSVTMGETSADFGIADKMPAMILEPEEEMPEETEGSS